MTSLRHTRTTSRRGGFTLVELLLAAALSVLIMTVIATAFQAGLASLSQLKSVGELQERLRAAEHLIIRDLKADHFAAEDGPRLSDQRLDLGPTGWQPPRQGFFRIAQSSIKPGILPNVALFEGEDDNKISSTRAWTHLLHFTVKLPGKSEKEVFAAQAPLTLVADPAYSTSPMRDMTKDPTTFVSDWAEVAWFLGETPTGTTADPNVKTFTLYRRQRLLAPVNGMTWQTNAGQRIAFQDLSVPPSGVAMNALMNTPASITDPANRLGWVSSKRKPDPPATGFPCPTQFDTIEHLPPSSNGYGGDVVLTNVVSFEVKAEWDAFRPQTGNAAYDGPRTHSPPVGFGPTSNGSPLIPNAAVLNAQSNPDFPFDVLPLAPCYLNGYPEGTGNRGATGSPPAVGIQDRFARNNGTQPVEATFPRVFDTWTRGRVFNSFPATSRADWSDPAVVPGNVPNPNYVPLWLRVKALQIKLRIYDPKNQQTRQVTIVQEM